MLHLAKASLIVAVCRGMISAPLAQAAGQEHVLAQLDRGIVVQPVEPGKPAPAPAAPTRLAPARPEAPGILPDSANTAAPIRVAALDGQTSYFAGLSLQTRFEVVPPGANPDVVWDPATRDVLSGSVVVARDVDRDSLSGVIERTAAVRWLTLRTRIAPQAIRVIPDDALHRRGSRVEIDVENLAGRSLILFNISGDGTVQLLYPLGSDASMVSDAKYSLQLQVRDPLGADQIVAVTATRPLPEVEQAIRRLDRRRTPMRICEQINQYATPDTRVGMVSLLTAP